MKHNQSSSAEIGRCIDRVGPVATDVEMDLKGSRSLTNEQRVDAADDQGDNDSR